MVQWINLNWNNSFVNQTRFPSFCERSGAILPVLVGLTAGRQADEILVDSKIQKNLNFCADRIVRIFMVFNQGTLLS